MNGSRGLYAVRCTLNEAEAVYHLLADAGADLALKGFMNWTVPYPIVALERDIEGGVVTIVRDAHDAPVATYMLRTTPVHAYQGISWSDESATARYLNRMAVHPTSHGRGIGRWCLSHIRSEAAGSGIAAIRCDVLTANRALRAFYEKSDYSARGERSHGGWEFTVYEQRVTP